MRWIALIIGAILLGSIPLSIAGSSYPRQVDPSVAPEEIPYGPGLLQFYGLVLGGLSSGNFSGAARILAESGLIHIPSSVSYIFQRFNSLINSTESLLKSADASIGTATSLVSEGRLAEATPYIDSATSKLLEANVTLNQLQGAALQFAQNTGIPSSSMGEKVSSLQKLLATYISRVASLRSQITVSRTLVQTQISLSSSQKEAQVGSNLTLTGRLSAYPDTPLSGRQVTVYLAGSALARAVTGPDGSFSATVRLPFIYVRNVSAFASFLPSGPDSGLYSPSSSAEISLSLLFTTPNVTLSAPDTVYPGIAFTLRGSVSPRVSSAVLSAFGSTFAVPLGHSGSFSLNLLPPPNTASGPSLITLTVGPNGTLAPGSGSAMVLVSRIPPVVKLSAPSIAVVGLPFTISGTVLSNGTAVAGASVVGITPGTGVNTTTGNPGTFSSSVSIPPTVPSGYWTFTLGVYPKQSWVGVEQVQASVFVINPATLLFPGFGVVFLIAVLNRNKRGRAKPPQQEEVYVQPSPQESKQVPSLVQTYREAVRIVEGATGLKLLPSHTIREYLSIVSEKLSRPESFQYISLSLERMLYGEGVSPKDEERAERELETLKSFAA